MTQVHSQCREGGKLACQAGLVVEQTTCTTPLKWGIGRSILGLAICCDGWRRCWPFGVCVMRRALTRSRDSGLGRVLLSLGPAGVDDDICHDGATGWVGTESDQWIFDHSPSRQGLDSQRRPSAPPVHRCNIRSFRSKYKKGKPCCIQTP